MRSTPKDTDASDVGHDALFAPFALIAPFEFFGLSIHHCLQALPGAAIQCQFYLQADQHSESAILINLEVCPHSRREHPRKKISDRSLWRSEL